MRAAVIALPGGVAPAAIRYAPLAAALGPEAPLHLKDLEVYSGDEPPAGYSGELEVEAVSRFADSLGLDRFHLVGYSGGGWVALSFAGRHPERILSLALFEPAAVPGKPGGEERALRAELEEALRGLEGAEFMRAFMTKQVRPGVQLPAPAGPPPPWMRTRPAGLSAMMASFDAQVFDRESFRACQFPVLYAHGELTGHYEEVKLSVLARLLPDLWIRRLPGIHHFVSPEQLYSEEHVRAIRELWARAEAGVGVGA